jgi:NCAIR mutase (PurE)-related protein
MQKDRLKLLLEQVQSGQVGVEAALEKLRHLPFENLNGFATLDHHRSLRNGFPEVVLGEGKQAGQVVSIVQRLSGQNDRVLVTRVDKSMADEIQAELPELVYHPLPRLLVFDRSHTAEKRRGVLVITAGTADMPVAEEAAITAELMGNAVERMFDVGVAGIHRLLNQTQRLWDARVIVVAAGMDGALPSVVGGLTSAPVIAVPTSVGYGASFNGLAALLTMLNSCAAGVAVVNIDNGFGAGYLAGVINQMKASA